MTRLCHFVSLLAAIFFYQSVCATPIPKDTTLYKPVVDSLIRIALLAKQPNPGVIISKFRRPATDVVVAVEAFLKCPDCQIMDNNTYQAMKIDSVRMLLSSFKNAVLANEEDLIQRNSPANISFKANGWRVFKSIKTSERIHRKDLNFFCVASITKPVYLGSYAVVVVDRLFYHQRGGGYLQLLKREHGQWQTLAITQLWHH